MRNWVSIDNGIVTHVDADKEIFDQSAFDGVTYDSISVDNQKHHSVGDTFDVNECIKTSGREYAFKNGSLYGYTTIGADGFINDAYDMQDQLMHTYEYDDATCSFYSDRQSGRKKYYVGDAIPTAQRNQHPSEELIYYAEINGTPNEWYYAFSTLPDMESFASQFSATQLMPTSLRNNMIALPYWNRAPSIIGPYNYLMSIEGMGNENILSCYVMLTSLEASTY